MGPSGICVPARLGDRLAQSYDIIKRQASKQQQATLDASRHCLGARCHSELVEEQLQMSFHGVGGDAESGCDLLVDQAVGEKSENLPLSIAEDRADCRFAARPLPNVCRVFSTAGNQNYIGGRWNARAR